MHTRFWFGVLNSVLKYFLLKFTSFLTIKMLLSVLKKSKNLISRQRASFKKC